MAVYGRSKPYREPGHHKCGMCGIERIFHGNKTGYCSDCAQPARHLGWID